MSRFPVSPEKEEALHRRMERLELYEQDLREQFVRGAGSGGQKINKTSSTVLLQHLPSGLEVRCQAARSQALNRYFARSLLCDKLEEKLLGERSKRRQAQEKIRRQKRKRSKRAKEKVLEQKKIRSDIKSARRRPPSD